MIALFAALLVQEPPLPPRGDRLADSRSCYTLNMVQNGASRALGVTWQTIEHGVEDGRPIVKIRIHQSVNGGAFDMRDDFVLDAATLRPLRLVNTRNGRTHVTVAYGQDRITGERTKEDGSTQPIDIPLTEPVWEGNLYGPLFAALPLAEGAQFTLPYWQYDKGFGHFTVRVTGVETVATAEGPVEAWVLDAGASPERRLTYFVAKDAPMELGYRAGPGSQTLGGDCAALAAQP